MAKCKNDIANVKHRLSNLKATLTTDIGTLCVKLVNKTRHELMREFNRRSFNVLILGFTEYDNNAVKLLNINNSLKEIPGMPLAKSLD